MICGHQVGLRPVEEQDLPLLVRWRNDPRTRANFLTPCLLSLGSQKKWYEGLSKDPTRIQFMIVRLEDNKPIGTIGLSRIDYRNQSAENGPLLIDPSERDRGLALDAARTTVRYIFKELNLHRITLQVYAFNTASLRMVMRVGMRQEGVLRKAAFVNGEFQDVILLGLLREEWQDEGPGEGP